MNSLLKECLNGWMLTWNIRYLFTMLFKTCLMIVTHHFLAFLSWYYALNKSKFCSKQLPVNRKRFSLNLSKQTPTVPARKQTGDKDYIPALQLWSTFWNNISSGVWCYMWIHNNFYYSTVTVAHMFATVPLEKLSQLTQNSVSWLNLSEKNRFYVSNQSQTTQTVLWLGFGVFPYHWSFIPL